MLLSMRERGDPHENNVTYVMLTIHGPKLQHVDKYICNDKILWSSTNLQLRVVEFFSPLVDVYVAITRLKSLSVI
jgi:hypothetical protein